MGCHPGPPTDTIRGRASVDNTFPTSTRCGRSSQTLDVGAESVGIGLRLRVFGGGEHTNRGGIAGRPNDKSDVGQGGAYACAALMFYRAPPPPGWSLISRSPDGALLRCCGSDHEPRSPSHLQNRAGVGAVLSHPTKTRPGLNSALGHSDRARTGYQRPSRTRYGRVVKMSG